METATGTVTDAATPAHQADQKGPKLRMPKVSMPETFRENPKCWVFIALFGFVWYIMATEPHQQHASNSAESGGESR